MGIAEVVDVCGRGKIDEIAGAGIESAPNPTKREICVFRDADGSKCLKVIPVGCFRWARLGIHGSVVDWDLPETNVLPACEDSLCGLANCGNWRSLAEKCPLECVPVPRSVL